MGTTESRMWGLEIHDNEWLRLEVATLGADLVTKSTGEERFMGHLG
jgi:hypothetical protein